MPGTKIQDYISTTLIRKVQDATLNPMEIRVKNFFESITSLLQEENLWIFLLGEHSKIISTYSPKEFEENYSGFFLPMHLSSIHKRFYPTTWKGIEIQSFSCPFRDPERDKATHLLIITMDKDKDDLNALAGNIQQSLRKIAAQFTDADKEYHQLLTYLDAVDDGISACDQNGRVIYINESGCSMIGAKKEDILYKDIQAIVKEPILTKVIRDKTSYMDIEYYLKYKDRNIHMINSAFPVFDRENNIIGAIDIYRRIKRSYKSAAYLAGYGAMYKFEHFVGRSKALSEAIEISKRFALDDKNVLIIGESGTGKELFAQAIHNYSPRKDGPFVAINCASYPKDLFDSELFGYDEGAFTGAKKGGKAGKFELADGGTIFLDEIGEIPIHLQAKLLRVIESTSISRIGSNKRIDIDVRIIAATNKNLEDLIAVHGFREDLYYRLKVLYLYLEPLRNREEDVIMLAKYFVNKFSAESGKVVKDLDDEAKEFILHYHWPGNIRELENVIALSLFYCDQEYLAKECLIKAGMKNKDKETFLGVQPKEKLSKMTKEIILEALKENNGNKRKTAQQLGISRNTIYRILK